MYIAVYRSDAAFRLELFWDSESAEQYLVREVNKLWETEFKTFSEVINCELQRGEPEEWTVDVFYGEVGLEAEAFTNNTKGSFRCRKLPFPFFGC